MNTIQISTFQFSENHSVRAFEKDGISWFVASDVCKALEIQNPTQVLEKLDDDERAMFNIGLENQGLFDSRIKEVNIINESGLYILILRSRNAMKQGTIQHKFRKWVTSEVLPQIRRTGQYQIPPTQTALPNGLTLEQQDQIKQLHRQLVQVAPKEQQAKLAITLWSAVKAKFGVSYKEVAPEHYLEVMSLMARVAVEKGVLYGEVLDKEQPTPINKDYFSHLAKMTHYATEFEKIQSMMCQSQFSEESKQFLTSLNWRVNNGAGYLFVFKPDIHNDIKQAFDFLRQQSQLCV